MLQHMLECCLSALTQPHSRFASRLLPVDNTLFKVRPEIRCSGVLRGALKMREWKMQEWKMRE